MKSIYKYLTAVLLITSFGCQELDIENPNDPDTSLLDEDPQLIFDLGTGAIAGVWDAYTANDDGSFFNANVHMAWTADHTSMSNNFRSMWSQFKVEPRVQFNNSLTFPDLGLSSNPWADWNASIAQSNIVIAAVSAIPAADRTEAQIGALGIAYLAKGMAYGHLANVYDQAYLEGDNVEQGTLAGYGDILPLSVSALDAAIDIFDSGISYTSPAGAFNGTTYTEAQLSQIANTMAAHFIVSNARTRAENNATDWSAIRTYAQNGINFDLIVTDDGTIFSHDFYCLSGLFWYFRIDHRVLRRFNSTYPKRFPLEPSAVIAEDVLTGTGYNGDQRLGEYFAYSNDLSFFRLERGAQLRTHYWQGNINNFFSNDNCVGDVAYAKGYMNDLLLAEAENELGNTAAAIAILNDPANPRVAIGALPDVAASATQAEVRDLIFAERDIELGRTLFGLELFDMRRQDALQIGTILHFPVPADELAILEIDTYTFGGVNNADGVDTADGSNSWLN
ncbi:RagB/SusD family nutrient uptake outer membrane protein [Ekhidna sp. To15]|uniref:RagB/SusD family nutrient uptake outer membrane protein n=1 Tax=Ekhidna sp. To15 TaxID=3395267 RepID=UPI003F51E965